MKQTIALIVIVTALGGCSDSRVATPERATFNDESSTGPIVTFPDADFEMNRAVSDAQRDVAVFRERLRNPTPTQRIGLKGQFEEGDQTEHMWISNPRVEGDGFAGILANEPGYLSTPKLGDAVTIDVTHVSDWYVYDDGKLQGAYTLRVIRKRLEGEELKMFDEANGFIAE
jgi:uncharacterized protein YegJ (DUF2314 family)